MFRHRTHAIVLSSTDYGDFDRIVTINTKEFGNLSGIAKGAKRSMRRFGGALESGTYCVLSFVEKKGAALVRLEHVDVINPWMSIRAELSKYLLLCQTLELVKDLLPEHEKNSEVFSLLLHMITLLDGALDTNPNAFLLTFEVKLLRLTGFRPNLEQCVICKKALPPLAPTRQGRVPESEGGEGSALGFSPVKGGVVCRSCRTHEHDLSREAWSAMKAALGLELNTLPSFAPPCQAALEARRLLRGFIEIRVGKKLMSPEVAESVIRTTDFFSSGGAR